MNDFPDDAVELDETAYDLLLGYRDAVDAIAYWQEAKVKARDQLVATMGEALIGRYNGRRVVKVILTRPHRFDQTGFAADHPGLYQAYIRPADADVVRLSMPRDGQL